MADIKQTDIFRSIHTSLMYHAERQGKLALIQKAAEELGLLEREEGAAYWNWGNIEYYAEHATITLEFYQTGLTATLQAVTPDVYLARVAKELLPKVGTFEKSFDGEHNQIKFTTVYKGVKLVLECGTPKTCTVETVEETVEVPEKVIPAHTETKRRYVLRGDCAPMMERAGAPEIPQPEPGVPEPVVPEVTA